MGAGIWTSNPGCAAHGSDKGERGSEVGDLGIEATLGACAAGLGELRGTSREANRKA
jgi:hypothetical protein